MIGTMVKDDPLDNYGPLTEPWKEGTPTYNIKKLFDYCRKVNKEPIELTEEEREQFRTNRENMYDRINGQTE